MRCPSKALRLLYTQLHPNLIVFFSISGVRPVIYTERLYIARCTLYLCDVNKERGGLLRLTIKTFQIWQL